jgi:hypothetical protein
MTNNTPSGYGRRRRWPTALAAAALTILAAAACTNAGSAPPPSGPTPSASATAPHVHRTLGTLPVTIATGDIFAGATAADVDQYMEAVARLNVTAIRTDFLPDRGSSPWDDAKTISSVADSYGLKVHAILFPDQVPSIQEATDTCHDFAKHFAGSNITSVEFMNEPSAKKAFYAPRDRINYLRPYHACREAIMLVAHAQSWNVNVEPGATSAVGTTNPTDGVRATEWYESLYKLGLAKDACNVAMNVYDWPLGVYNTDNAAKTKTPDDPNFRQVKEVHDTMVRYGRGSCRVDMAEVGWPTGGADSVRTVEQIYASYPSQPQAVDNAVQALNIGDALQAWYHWYRQGIAGGLGIYSAVDNAAVDGTEANFGVYAAREGDPVLPGDPKCGTYTTSTGKVQTICAADVVSRFMLAHRDRRRTS